MIDAATELNRLRWRCTRRALLEMDILLGTFLEKEYHKLTPQQAAAFSALADMEDHPLWAMIIELMKHSRW